MNHGPECFCDTCRNKRTREMVSKRLQEDAQRERDAQQKRYEALRGAPIGSISVAEALKERNA